MGSKGGEVPEYLGEIPVEALGPAMLALPNDRQRRFAYLVGCGESLKDAAIAAGYSAKGDNAKQNGCRARHSPGVAEAIQEVARLELSGLAPIAIQRAAEILANRKHPAHARMIETVLDRTGFFARTEHKVTVERVGDERVMAIAARLALELGVDRAKLVGPNLMIEGKAEKADAGES